MVVRRNLRHFNDRAFLNDLALSDIHYTFEIPDVNSALDHFFKAFLSGVNKHAPYKNVRIGDRSNPWFNSGIKHGPKLDEMVTETIG